jgi:glycosyltransferase involved in cell wall biosynthesis
MTKLYLAIPCYNEEEVLPNTAEILLNKYQQLISDNLINTESKICFIDDGSNDKTWSIIKELCNKNNFFCGIKLSCNKGHQNALLSGLVTLKDYADAVISIDADLQDDTSVIEDMIDKYHDGCDIVYGVRNSRKKDTFFKRTTAQGYYKLMDTMGVKTVYNHADFRLMSKRSLEAFSEYKETNLYLR